MGKAEELRWRERPGKMCLQSYPMRLARSHVQSQWHPEVRSLNPSLGLQTLLLVFFKQSRNGLLNDKISFMVANKISGATLFGMLNLGLAPASSGTDA